MASGPGNQAVARQSYRRLSSLRGRSRGWTRGTGYSASSPRDATRWRMEALVTRHGPMVLGVSPSGPGEHATPRRMRFQATFLILAKRAGTIRDPDRLGP